MTDKQEVKTKTIDDEAIEAAEKAKPSGAPDYWSKKSCNHCYGRGVIGTITKKVDTNTVVNSVVCDCGKRRFSKWRDQWVKEYKAALPERRAQFIEAVKKLEESSAVPVLSEPATVVDIPA